MVLPPIVERQRNLLINGDFERGTDGVPDHWTRYTGSAAQLQWTRSRAVSGTSSARVTLHAVAPVEWRQRLEGIDPQVRYRFRAWVYATNVAEGSHAVELQWLDASDHVLARTAAAASVSGRWTEVKASDVVAPPGAVAVVVALRGSQPGTYDFDGVVFTRQDESVHDLGSFPLGVWELTRLNLLSNSTVEQRRGTGMRVPGEERQRVCAAPGQCDLPAFWNTWVESGSVTQGWERLGPAQHALRTQLVTDGEADWRQSVPDVDPLRHYRLAARVLASNIEPGAHTVEVRWLDASGGELGRHAVAATTADTWTSLELRSLVPPPGTTSALVVLRSTRAGTYLFDDIYLEVDATQVERLRELKDAGFSLAPAFGTQPAPGEPSLDEVGAAGLKAFYRGIHLVAESATDARAIASKVSDVQAHPALALYLAADEPAWELYTCPRLGSERTGLCPEATVGAYQAVRSADAQWDAGGHRVWMNHAPRGTPSEPEAFDYLARFNPAADIISMDVYPVPLGNGHVNLSNQTLSSVGDYAEILYGSVVRERERQARPIWMVLQGFGWEDLRIRTPDDGGDTLTGHRSMALEVHWLDEAGAFVTEPGPDGSSERVVSVLQTDHPNAWREVYEQALQPPPSARTAVVRLRAYGPGTFWFDDVGLREEGGAELLRNGSFESGAAGTPEGWRRGPGTALGEQTWDTHAHTGSRALRIHLRQEGLMEWEQRVPVRPGARYRLSGALYSQVRPTWEETRFMAYDAIVHGARGLSWWGTQLVPHNSGLWADLKRLAGELRELSPALLAPATFREVEVSATDGQHGDAVLLEHGADLYLVVTNPSPYAADFTVEVDGPPLTQVERLFEAGSATWNERTVSDAFGPYQVRVYRLR